MLIPTYLAISERNVIMADHIIVIDEDNENEIPPPARAYWHQPALAPRRQRDDQVNLSNAAIRERLQYSRNRGPNITIAIPENLTLLNYDTHIKVGVLQEDHPFSAAQVKSGANEQKPERRPGQPVYFGLGLNYETGIVDWAWRTRRMQALAPDTPAWMMVTILSLSTSILDPNPRSVQPNMVKDYQLSG
ncbi:hypothetical protein EDB82DRAFT_475948 [Fusarium venenatum]|uniref:uncharacterized protein n=1 Tax=Fusarium venenatum TaxID=56646 RepID=UPI001DC90129|nr:hypothetical protein EDB82DRAFT_475948 [Fusarium venenatum]